MRLRRVLTFCLLVLAAAPSVAYADAGRLDTTFNNGVGTLLTGTNALPGAMAVLPDGRWLIAVDTPSHVGVMRFNADGSVDTSYGSGGYASTSGELTRYVFDGPAMAVQPDGKVVLAGTTGAGLMRVVRFTASGALDSTGFGSGGSTTKDIGGAADANSVIVESNGKLLVAGDGTASGHVNFALWQLNANGSDDASFGGGGGVKLVSFPSGMSQIGGVVQQPSGAIVAAGTVQTATHVQYVLARFDSTSGVQDASFGPGGSGGTVKTPVGDGDATVLGGVVQQADGKLIILGTGALGAAGVISLARYSPDGVLDPSYGVGGITSDTLAGSSVAVNGGAFQPDGKLVIAGYSDFNGTIMPMVARYTTSGSLDPTFGEAAGYTRTPVGTGPISYVTDIRLLPDGRVVITGANKPSVDFDLFLARYTGDSPSAHLKPATGIGTTVAAVTGVVNTGGWAGETYRFEYGTSAQYGSSTPSGPLSAGMQDQIVTSPLGQLAPATTYHYRLVATSPSGTSTTADGTFATGSAPSMLDRSPPRSSIGMPRCRARTTAAACRARRSVAAAWRTLHGTVTDPAPSSGIARVQVNVVRRAGHRCLAFDGRGFRRLSCAAAAKIWVTAKLKRGAWTITLGPLSSGEYVVRSRGIDRAGNVERRFVSGRNQRRLLLSS